MRDQPKKKRSIHASRSIGLINKDYDIVVGKRTKKDSKNRDCFSTYFLAKPIPFPLPS